MTIKKFYTSSFAPNPLRINYMLKLKGLNIDTVDIDMMKGENLSADYKKISPEGTLPALILDDGTTLTDVIAIAHYIERTYPDTPLMGETNLEQAQILGMMHRILFSGLMGIAEVLRNGFMPGFEGRGLPGNIVIDQIPALMDRGTKRLAYFYEMINTLLENKEYLVGEKISQADIDLYVCCNFANFIEQPLDKEAVPNLAAHLKRLNSVLAD